MSELDETRVGAALEAAGLQHRMVKSQAASRDEYIRRPDLGPRLSESGRDSLEGAGPLDVALVLGDGLSAIDVALNWAAFITALAERLAQRALTVGSVILARQARVALGDGIAQAIGAQTVVMALAERPDLSAADSPGVYIAHRPKDDTTDSARNCISNIRAAELALGTLRRGPRS